MRSGPHSLDILYIEGVQPEPHSLYHIHSHAHVYIKHSTPHLTHSPQTGYAPHAPYKHHTYITYTRQAQHIYVTHRTYTLTRAHAYMSIYARTITCVWCVGCVRV